MKFRVEHSGTCKTYTVLRHTAWHLLDHAKEYESGSLLQVKASAVLCAFTFEAYLNHVGSEEIEFWEEIERIPYKKKLRIIQGVLGINIKLQERPFQTIFELFDLRDGLAHGRTRQFSETFATTEEPPHDSIWNVLPWEKLTVQQGERYLADLEGAIERINSARSKPDDFLWNQGMRSKTVSMIEP